MDFLTLTATIVNIIILFSVFELVRRNRLKEKYSLLWLFSSFVLLFFSVSRGSLHFISRLIGIQYPPSLIFLLGFLFLIVINIHYSTVLSKLSEQNKTLSQEISLLKHELRNSKSK